MIFVELGGGIIYKVFSTLPNVLSIQYEYISLYLGEGQPTVQSREVIPVQFCDRSPAIPGAWSAGRIHSVRGKVVRYFQG